ncbi:hypothetical protein GCM10025768_28240 [Microbacterium pseudoresistens]|uniref:DUF222 domain-containing protein n=1 Tax=Microbacterium pseudoresistens TaxID=640634 RepID=A0A7Y9EU55_9MICO|nr:DUF222 domain-containing protein [Microbacterium pseudoresistens]NYD53836.1 hypothetical protein [Microbacterium pseudoresistens]NYD54745.1 hypothetical protein [Microbacterium pseudoresistens]
MGTTPGDYLSRSREIAEECGAISTEIARLEAQRAELLAERVVLLLDEIPPGRHGFEQAERSMDCEISAALHVTRGAAMRMLATSWVIYDRFPATRDALAAGEISFRHATVITAAAAPIPRENVEAIAAFEAQVMPYATEETAARTEAFAKSVAAAVAPETVVERHERARRRRSVSVSDLEDGLSILTLILPSVQAHGIMDRVSATARGIRDNAARGIRDNADRSDDDIDDQLLSGQDETPTVDDRTLDEIRADIAADLLLTGTTTITTDAGLDGVHATVQVTIAATTLAGLDDKPAELDGHGPLHPDIARRLAGHATSWSRLFLDQTGMVTRVDRYTPTNDMKRYL